MDPSTACKIFKELIARRGFIVFNHHQICAIGLQGYCMVADQPPWCACYTPPACMPRGLRLWIVIPVSTMFIPCSRAPQPQLVNRSEVTGNFACKNLLGPVYSDTCVKKPEHGQLVPGTTFRNLWDSQIACNAPQLLLCTACALRSLYSTTHRSPPVPIPIRSLPGL